MTETSFSPLCKLPGYSLPLLKDFASDLCLFAGGLSLSEGFPSSSSFCFFWISLFHWFSSDVATVANSLPTHIRVCNTFIYCRKMSPHDAHLSLCHHAVAHCSLHVSFQQHWVMWRHDNRIREGEEQNVHVRCERSDVCRHVYFLMKLE